MSLLNSNLTDQMVASRKRKTTAQGIALGARPPTNPSPERVEQKPMWESTTIGEIAEINPRLNIAHIDDDTLASFVPMKCVEAKSGRCVPTENKKVGEVKKGYTPMQDGDVIMAKVTPCMENGKAAVMQGLTNGIGFGSTEFYVLRPSERILSKFLFYFIIQESFRSEAERHMTGAVGLRRVPRVFIENHTIPLPPLPEQRRIVARIEELFSRLDAGLAALHQAKAQLKRYRQSVLTAAVTGELTKQWREQRGLTLQDWRKTTLGDASRFVTSGSRSWANYYSDHGPLFIRAQNIKTDALVLDDLAHVRPPVGCEGARTRVFENDLLITITGANVTKSARVEAPLGEAYVSQHVALVRPLNPEQAPFLYYAIVSPRNGRAFLEEKAYGAGKPGLNLTHVKEVPIWLPPIAEQHQIVAEVEARTTAIDHLEAELDRQITRSKLLRQSTLASAFSGLL